MVHSIDATIMCGPFALAKPSLMLRVTSLHDRGLSRCRRNLLHGQSRGAEADRKQENSASDWLGSRNCLERY